MTTLVLGATGYVGRHLLPHLHKSGHKLRCLVRDPSKQKFEPAESITGNALDREALSTAVRGVDRIVYLIHSMTGDDESFEDRDVRIARLVGETAAEAEVKQIVYLGGLGKRDDTQTPHLRSRHTVARILRESGVPVTELRAAVVVGAGSASFEMIRYLVSRLPVMITPRWVDVKTQPIAIDDVLSYIEKSLAEPKAAGESIDIGGPDVLSYRQMMLTVARQMGYRRLIIPVPVLTPWLSSHWVNLVTPVAASLARALIESVRSETVCENDLAARIFDVKPMTFEQAVAGAIAAPQSG